MTPRKISPSAYSPRPVLKNLCKLLACLELALDLSSLMTNKADILKGQLSMANSAHSNSNILMDL
jgi:hypothetical protein